MNAKLGCTRITTLATGLLIGGAVLTLTTTGCERLPTEQAAAWAGAAVNTAPNALDAVTKLDPRSKLSANHNETFLVGAPA